MDPASGLLALQDRGPGFALPPGAARRFAPPLNNNVWIGRSAIIHNFVFFLRSTTKPGPK